MQRRHLNDMIFGALIALVAVVLAVVRARIVAAVNLDRRHRSSRQGTTKDASVCKGAPPAGDGERRCSLGGCHGPEDSPQQYQASCRQLNHLGA